MESVFFITLTSFGHNFDLMNIFSNSKLKTFHKWFPHLSLVPQGRERECSPPWKYFSYLTDLLAASTYCLLKEG